MKQIWLLLLLSISATLNAQDDTTLSQVNSRNGYVYKNNVLFTGILYSDESANNECKCTLEANYSKGKLNGIKKEWFKSGMLKYEGVFKNGKIVGIAKKYDENGVAILTKQSISTKQILEYALKLNPPDNYTDEFLRLYLREFDVNYDNYRSDEFELNRRKNSVKNKITTNINALSFNTTYQETKKTKLPKYSFSSKSFNLKTGGFLNYVKDPIKHLFSRTNMTSNNKRLSNDLLKVNIANQNDFYEIKMSSDQAEQLKNNFNYHNLYYAYDYQIIPTKYKFKYGESGNYNVGGILAYISTMRFYSDKNLTNLVHTINATRTYEQILTELNGTKKTSVTNLGNNVSIKNIDYKDFLIGEWQGVNGAQFIIYDNNTLKYFYDKSTTTPVDFTWTYKNPILKLTPTKEDVTKKVYSRGGTINQRNNNNNNIRIRYLSNNTIAMYSNNGANLLGSFTKTTNTPIGKAVVKNNSSYNTRKNTYQNGVLQKENDETSSLEYLLKSAKEGNGKVQEKLANIYYSKKDFKNALKWYTKAANNNEFYSQYILGAMYRKGQGVKKSRKKAKSWWKKSCQLGYKESCEEVKKMNAFGNALLNSVNESIKKTN